jgi:membrane fusion protein (multidrug efflux system)
MISEQRKKIIRGMLIMLLIVGVIFGGIFGYKWFQMQMIRKSMAGQKMPPVTVTATKAEWKDWQPNLKAVGSLRAVRGVEVTCEIAGLVRSINFQPGQNVSAGQLLVQLNADSDMAQLHSLEAAVALAKIVYERDLQQYAVLAVSKAVLDADEADLKIKQEQVAQQKALVEKKSIRAPFDGRLGISTVNLGQYLNPGDKIVTLQSLDVLYNDFSLPQQELGRIKKGQVVIALSDTYPGRAFRGRVTTINPKVEADTRNVQVESVINNPRGELLPGMFVGVEIDTGVTQKYLTLPQTAVSFNPYGEMVFIVEKGEKDASGHEALTVKQTIVTVGATRGDQAAILSGIKEGDIVVTSGHFKLKPSSAVVINNKVQPKNDAGPKPVDE